jgi:hypothetical protein
LLRSLFELGAQDSPESEEVNGKRPSVCSEPLPVQLRLTTTFGVRKGEAVLSSGVQTTPEEKKKMWRKLRFHSTFFSVAPKGVVKRSLAGSG